MWSDRRHRETSACGQLQSRNAHHHPIDSDGTESDFFFFMFCFASLCLASNSIRVASNWVFGDGDVRPSCRLRLGVTTAGIDTASQCAQCALINRYDIECCWTVWIEINWLIGHQSAYIALWSARVPIIHKLNRIKIISSNDSLGRMPLAANTYLYFFIQ